MFIGRLPEDSLFNILERMAGEGYLQNNRNLAVDFDFSSNPRFVEMICSMRNVESLD